MLRCRSCLRSSRKDENEWDACTSIGVPNEEVPDESPVIVLSRIDSPLVRRSNDSLNLALARAQACSTAASSADPSDRGGLSPAELSESGESGRERSWEATTLAGVASMMRIETTGDRAGLLHAVDEPETGRGDCWRACRKEDVGRWVV